jgi:RNA polymerase sigma-70 factor (ECF subfamily)
MTNWKSIVQEHEQLVWNKVYRLVGNDADALDCFQETFLEAVRVDRKEKVRDWAALLRHLATARALDLLRVRYRDRDRTDPLVDLSGAISREPGPRSQAEASELADRLRAALAQLPANQAEVFCLCRLDGMTYREAAAELNIDANTAGVLLHRACNKLQQLLASAPIDCQKTKKDTKRGQSSKLK